MGQFEPDCRVFYYRNIVAKFTQEWVVQFAPE